MTLNAWHGSEQYIYEEECFQVEPIFRCFDDALNRNNYNLS